LTKFNIGDNFHINTPSPKVSLFQFQNALVEASSSSIVYQNKVLVTRSNNERISGGFIKFHNRKDAKIYIDESENIESGFSLAGNGSWNWFHFLIEILPKLLFIDKKYTDTILVNEFVLTKPTMKEILFLLNKEGYKIRYLKQGVVYKVNNLFYLNDFNHVHYNRFDDLLPSDGTYFNSNILKKYSDLLLTNFNFSSLTSTPTHIYLYRKNTHRIAQNQDEVLEYLKPFGFVPVCMEELSIAEQIKCFKEAKFIIGITGAAWSNLLFCRNSPKAIYFLPDNVKEFSTFSNLAKIFNVDLYGQVYQCSEFHYSNNFTIDMNHFHLLFTSIHEK
jgi:capsular polysaccharide biosynthesis protein